MLGPLTLAAAAALFCVSAAYNVVPSSGARFGTASQRLTLDGADPRKLETDVAAIRAWFGTVELIGHRQVATPGSVETLLARASRQRAAGLPATVHAQWESRPQCHATLICLTPGQSEQATAAAGVLGMTTVALLLVSLIAAAGFVVVAQRRLRQLGMLAMTIGLIRGEAVGDLRTLTATGPGPSTAGVTANLGTPTAWPALRDGQSGPEGLHPRGRDPDRAG